MMAMQASAVRAPPSRLTMLRSGAGLQMGADFNQLPKLDMEVDKSPLEDLYITHIIYIYTYM